jgi:hypothetical protein
MGYNGGYNGGGQARGGFGRGGGRGGKFEPRPGSGTLFVKSDKRNQQAPDYDGYFIPDRDIRAGEKIKLVGWDKQGSGAPMITLKFGRDRQDAPGYNEGGNGNGYQPQQNGYQQPPQGGYGPGPGYNNGGYQGQPQGYQQPPQGGYRPAPAPGSYQGGGYGGQPVQTYQPPAGQPPVGQTPPNAAAAAPAPAGPVYSQPPPDDELPF